MSKDIEMETHRRNGKESKFDPIGSAEMKQLEEQIPSEEFNDDDDLILNDVETLHDGEMKEIKSRERSNAGAGCPRLICCSFLKMDLVLGYSKVNWLLLASPLAVVSKLAGFGHGPTFLFSLLALIPQAQLLGLFTEQVALYTNDAIGGLLNATFGNLTELIISILALRKDMMRIVQVSLLGSVLSNCLLVLGSAFLLGGLRHTSQKFNRQMATTNSGLLMISTMAMLLPAALDASNAERSDSSVLSFSRFTALLLLGTYVLLMIFQMKTHRHLLEEEDGEGDDEERILTFKEAVIWLVLDTVLISGFSEILVGSIEGSAEDWHIPKVFIGVIILPIVGNAGAKRYVALDVMPKNSYEFLV